MSAQATHQSTPKNGQFQPVANKASGLLQRKCASCGTHTIAGGECSECSKGKRLPLQTKLAVNEAGDIYEQEADRIADQVLAAPLHPNVSHTPPRIQRFAGQPAKEAEAVPASVDRVLASSGRPLEPGLRQDMEQRFGYDFSGVWVHSGGAAEQSARELNANAYTVGNNLVFGAGQFRPRSHEGQWLVAHELAHVIQQDALASVPRVQRQERQSDASAIGTNEANDEEYSARVTPSVPRYHIRVVGHASPRWRHPGASTPEQQNLALSEQRAQAVESVIRFLFRTRERPVEFDLTSDVIDSDADSLEPSGRGMEETLREVGGARDVDDPILRRVDVEVNVIESVMGRAGSTEAVTLPTATTHWSIKADVIEAAGAVASTIGQGELENRETGQKVSGIWAAVGLGGGIDLPIPSVSPGSWANFETINPVTFFSFDNTPVRLTTLSAGVGFGYGKAYFSFINLMSEPVDISGPAFNQWGIGGSVTFGLWEFAEQIPPPPTEGREREIPSLTTAPAQHGLLVLFHTGESSITEAERVALADFVARFP